MTTEEFKLISIEETIEMIRELKTDFAQTRKQAEEFIKNNFGIKESEIPSLLGISESSGSTKNMYFPIDCSSPKFLASPTPSFIL